uniref:Protein Iojap, chloroplastic n=1 Tax=Quercus lobata TaxID=97700 RepID=A0A7N2MGG1_QUELO
MAVSTMLSITGTGAGNPFTGEFRPLGLFELKFYERPRKPYGSSCMNGHHFPHHKCIWRIPSNRNLNSKSKDSSLVLAIGKEVERWESEAVPMSVQAGGYNLRVQVRVSEIVSIVTHPDEKVLAPKPQDSSMGHSYVYCLRSKWLNCLIPIRKMNVSEDTDDMYDELFNKYGKVVFRRKDQKPQSAEVDDDAESLSFAVELANVASQVKAADIKVLFVKPLVYWTRFFIITTAFSRPQIDAIGSKIRDLAEKKYGRVPSGDTKPNSWTLLDFGDVVVHIFLPQQRAFYNLEEFYANATPIELPFENQPPFHG